MMPFPVLVGRPFAPIGRGEDTRCCFRAFRAVGLAPSVFDIYAGDDHRDSDVQAELHLTRELSPSVNLFVLNGDEINRAFKKLQNNVPSTAHNIVFPQWELDEYPCEWARELERFDEVWAPSGFVYKAIRRATSMPSTCMPLSVEIELTSFLGRRYFKIPESSYVFLFCFDFRSYIERKNPLAVLEAFDRLCSLRTDEDVRLVIKTNGSSTSTRSKEEFQQLAGKVERCAHSDKIIVIDEVYKDNEIKNLIRCSDCFVSLHRSEGFGRALAEAMLLGKPVIATGYSGNLGFMNEENSCLVQYELVDVGNESYPNAENRVWAKPDLDHAVYYMLKLLQDRDYGRRLGQIASRDIRTHFSHRAVGLMYAKHLEKAIKQNRSQEST